MPAGADTWMARGVDVEPLKDPLPLKDAVTERAPAEVQDVRHVAVAGVGWATRSTEHSVPEPSEKVRVPPGRLWPVGDVVTEAVRLTA